MTRRAPARRVAHFDQRISYAGGTLGDSLNGSRLAHEQGYPWIDCNGHLTADLMWVNGHGDPYNPGWLKRGDKYEHHTAAELHRKHKALRSAHDTFRDNARLGLKTEWEVKDLHPLTSDRDLEIAFRRLAHSARAAYGETWQPDVQVKVLTNLRGGLAYARKIGRHAGAAGFDVIVLPRGVNRLRKINGPEFTWNRGGRV